MLDMQSLGLHLDFLPFTKVDRDLWKVLVDKCDPGTAAGDILKRLESQDMELGGEPGLEAFRRIEKHSNERKNIDIAELRERVMNPDRPKREEEVLKRLETWECDQRELSKMDSGLAQMDKKWLLIPFKKLLTGKEQEEMRTLELRWCLEGKTDQEIYDLLRKSSVEWLTLNGNSFRRAASTK